MAVYPRSSAPQPRCPQCRSSSLTLMEEFSGMAQWTSDEWSLDESGELVTLQDSGWSGATPTGRWFYECEDCGHGWTKRRNRG